jgi:hypothetical protein
MSRIGLLPSRPMLRRLGTLAFGMLAACGSSQDDAHDGGDARAASDSGITETGFPTEAPGSADAGLPPEDGGSSDGVDADWIGGEDGGGETGRSDGGPVDGEGGRPTMIPCSGCTLYQWDIPGAQLIHDFQRDRLYVTVGGAARERGNTLVTISMTDQALMSAPFIGSNPRALSLSDDASTLWVGIDGSFSIRKVTLTTTPPTLGIPHLLPQESGPLSEGPAVAGRIVPLPGSPGSVAVMSSAQSARVYILDEGAPRATDARIFGITDLVAGPPGHLFGYNGSNTGHDFFTVAVSPSGVTSSGSFRGLIRGFSVRIHHSSGRVFAETGQTVDVTNPTSPVAGPRLALPGRMAVQSPSRLLVITDTNAVGGTTAWRLAVLNPAEAVESDFVTLPASIFAAPVGEKSTVTQLISAGTDAAAFLVFTPEARFSGTGRTYLYVVRSSILRAP